MPWSEILELLGPGLHYSKPRQVYLDAIKEAQLRQNENVVEHLKIMLARRDDVSFDTPNTHPKDHWLFGDKVSG